MSNESWDVVLLVTGFYLAVAALVAIIEHDLTAPGVWAFVCGAGVALTTVLNSERRVFDVS